MAWLTAGVPGNRLVRLVKEQGTTGALNKEQIRQLESAGADVNLIQAVTKSKVSATANSDTLEIPAALVQAAVEAHNQRFHEAELHLRQALRADPQNGALHFALSTTSPNA